MQKCASKNLFVKDIILLLQHSIWATIILIMRITILQTDIKWGDASVNQNNAEELLGVAPKSDLYVLPEMWTTGFTMSPEAYSEKAGWSLQYGTIAWMIENAKQLDAAICGSVAIEGEDGRYYNRLCFASPDGTVVFYDKRHLFSIGGENRQYTSGSHRVVASFRGVRFLLQICYDLRFPVWSRNNDDYDVAIYVANWPEGRQNVWDVLLRARAIENQCYVVGANRVGQDKSCRYKGGSAIISPRGDVIEDDNFPSNIISADIDIEGLKHFRRTFPVLADRDRMMQD